MNIPCANDDEDFPVFKAGPPLPIRTKTKPNCKIKSVPMKATSTLPPRVSSRTEQILVSPGSSSPVINAESKVKQYIEKVKAIDEQGRKKRIKPEQMLSLEDLYQVKVPSFASKDTRTNVVAKSPPKDGSLTEVHDKLRETLRIVKEKDELIIKLRESCHDLAIKCADAENRVDELRFSYGRSSFSGGTSERDKMVRSSSITGQQQHPLICSQFDCIPRRCVSAEEGLNKCGVNEGVQAEGKQDENENLGRLDKSTDTGNQVTKCDAETQMDNVFGNCPDEVKWSVEDDILQETCSNWMEKIHNWKTDSNFNLSQDSGGDKDSGFRGSSAEIDAESTLKGRNSSLLKSHRKCHGHGERSSKAAFSLKSNTAQLPQMSSSSMNTVSAPQQPGCSRDDQETIEEEKYPSQQHFWPSFSSSSQSNLNDYQSANFPSDSTKAKSLFYEMAEADRNKYACFQEAFHSKRKLFSDLQNHRMVGSKSLEGLHVSLSSTRPTTEELRSLIDNSFDPPETILKSHLSSQARSIDKKVKMLGPLLDDTTQIALRVKMKSERLAKMLNDACTLE